MLKEIIISIQAYLEAHRFIVKHKLWKWIFIPGLIYCILFIAGIYLFWVTSNSAIEWVLLKSGTKAWLESMHDSWLNFLIRWPDHLKACIVIILFFSF